MAKKSGKKAPAKKAGKKAAKKAPAKKGSVIYSCNVGEQPAEVGHSGARKDVGVFVNTKTVRSRAELLQCLNVIFIAAGNRDYPPTK